MSFLNLRSNNVVVRSVFTDCSPFEDNTYVGSLSGIALWSKMNVKNCNVVTFPVGTACMKLEYSLDIINSCWFSMDMWDRSPGTSITTGFGGQRRNQLPFPLVLDHN